MSYSSETFEKVMVRLAIDKKYGCDLASIECKDIELQFLIRT